VCEHGNCNVPAEPGQELCILHLASPKDVDRFKEVLYQKIDETGPEETRSGRFSFASCHFPCGIRIGADTDRKTSSDVLLPVVIEGDVDFVSATIEGNARFDGARIKGNVFFGSAELARDVGFENAEVEGDVYFGDAKVKGLVWFGRSEIGGDVWSSDAEIGGDVYFGDAKIGGNVLFHDTRIEKGIWFDGARIGGNVLFQRAKIVMAGFADAAIDGDVWFDSAEIDGRLDLENVKIGGSASFNGFSCRYLRLGLNKPRIRGWGEERCGTSITDPEAAVSFWRFAQAVFSKTGERGKADAAFYFERLNRWRILRRIKADDYEPWMRRLWQNWVIRPGYWFLFLLDLFFVRWTTAYGASIARLFTTWFAVIGGFAAAFSLNPGLIGRAEASVWTLSNWIDGVHYSVTTFATLGLGDLSPGESSLGKVLTSVEALLGAVLIALAVLVLGRKFMRQG